MRWIRIGVSKKGMGLLLGLAGLLAAGVVLCILPARSELRGLQSRAAELEAELRKQEILQPLYTRLKDRQKQLAGRAEKIKSLGVSLDPPDIAHAAKKLEDMAAEAGLGRAEFAPSPQSVTRDAAPVLFIGRLQGAYPAFQAFLLRLLACGGTADLKSLQAVGREDNTEYRLRVWMDVS